MHVSGNLLSEAEDDPVCIVNPQGAGRVILVCEHASRVLPASVGTLGLSEAALESHIAWDPGALAVAKLLSARLDATLVYQRYSRLVYDCNRGPESPAAMPETSEVYEIPGNRNLSAAERERRTSALYVPFRSALGTLVRSRIEAGRDPVLVTMHSFTPVYHGVARAVEIGILHDSDRRLADRMLAAAEAGVGYAVRRNEPYGPQDGVTHTLKEHALPHGIANVMIEVRNDLIRDDKGQERAADCLESLLSQSILN